MLLFTIFMRFLRCSYKNVSLKYLRNYRLKAYVVLKEKDFLSALNFISDKAKSKIGDEERFSVDKRVKNECSKVLKKYQEYPANKKSFDDIETKLENYKKFYEHIFVLPRPVVGIYCKEENKFCILCCDHFDSKVNKNTKIDLKNITQNNLIIAEIGFGCQILSLRKEEKRKEELHELEKKKMELEIAKLEKENKLMEQEEAKNELDVLNKSIELKMRLASMAETEENSGIKSMASSYANRQLCIVYNKVQNGYNEVLKTNKFIEKSHFIIDHI